MIRVTRLNHTQVVLNSDLIEYIETTPDTVITLTTGQKLMVLEAADEVVSRVIRYRHMLLEPPATDHVHPDCDEIRAVYPSSE